VALYDGFFDAVLNEETGKYDREYNSGDFVGYFGSFLGDGVCVFNNPDSMKLTYADGAAQVSPGYLFIQGYWLKNDGIYEVPIPGGAQEHAVVAHLNTSLRFIEITAVDKASPEVYPDCLVLGYVTKDGQVTDTRDTALCGVIDAVGSLSQKVTWAVDYIDTQIEARLREAENRLNAQSERLDDSINKVMDELSKVAPPPVGTIKFSAAAQEDDWLRCDGSFVSADRYPKLVEALGKINPGISDFDERLNANEAEQLSNICIYGGLAWVYMVGSRQLAGFGQYSTVRISVVGAEAITAGEDVVLSISDGSLWLAQTINQVFEAAEFTGQEGEITVTQLNFSSVAGAEAFSQNTYPSVVKVNGTCYMAYGQNQYFAYVGSLNAAHTILKYLTWKPGQFGSAEKKEYTTNHYGLYNSGLESRALFKLLSIMAFTDKNSNELLMPNCCLAELGDSINIGFGCGSILNNTYSDPQTGLLDSVSSNSLTNKYYQRYLTDNYSPQLNILPVAANKEIFYTADLNSRKITVTYCAYSPKSFPEWYEIPIELPDRARLFKDSVCYAQGMWFVFVGTGLLFCRKLSDAQWGYLDMLELFPAIINHGSLYYEQSTNALYISGCEATGMPRVYRFQLPESFDYSTTGAWLPTLSIGGVPGYIKAQDNSAKITVSAEPSNAGTVTGGGVYSQGSVVKLLASPKSPSTSMISTFTGWYEGEALVSEETAYSFVAEGSRDLVAKFTVTKDPALALPSPYREVEYIIVDTNPGIDTGIKPSSATLRLYMELEMPAEFKTAGDIFTSKDKLMSQNAAGQTWSYLCEVYRTAAQRLTIRSGYNKTFTLDGSIGGKQILDYNGPAKTMRMGGTTISIDTGTELQDSNLFIGRLSSTSSRKAAIFNIYTCRLYVNGILMRDFVPCVDGSAQAGFYDRVTKSFYGNSLSGSLGAGPLVE